MQLAELKVPLNLPVAQRTQSPSTDWLRMCPGVHCTVGEVVGWSVGLAVGDAVGDAVGSAVGSAVGVAVGSAVGTAVGAAVGTATHVVCPCSPAVHVPPTHSWHTWYSTLSWYLPDGQW